MTPSPGSPSLRQGRSLITFVIDAASRPPVKSGDSDGWTVFWMVYYRFWPEFLPKIYIDKNYMETIITKKHQFQGECFFRKGKNHHGFPPGDFHTCAQHLAVWVQCVGGSPWGARGSSCAACSICSRHQQLACFCHSKRHLPKEKQLFRTMEAPPVPVICLLLLFFELFHDIS